MVGSTQNALYDWEQKGLGVFLSLYSGLGTPDMWTGDKNHCESGIYRLKKCSEPERHTVWIRQRVHEASASRTEKRYKKRRSKWEKQRVRLGHAIRCFWLVFHSAGAVRHKWSRYVTRMEECECRIVIRPETWILISRNFISHTYEQFLVTICAEQVRCLEKRWITTKMERRQNLKFNLVLLFLPFRCLSSIRPNTSQEKVFRVKTVTMSKGFIPRKWF